MVDSAQLLIFVSAAILLAISPGPGLLYVLARSLQGGVAVGLASASGAAVGGMIHVVAAAFGLSAILARSASAFLIVKYLGAAYLIYLGIRTWRTKDADLPPAGLGLGARNPFWQGFLTEALNPKTALFFLSFIPQFVNHASPLLRQFLILGTISVCLNTVADIAIVAAAAPLSRRMRSSSLWRRRQRQASAAALVGLGGYVIVGANALSPRH